MSLRVLVVDDEADIRLMARMYLRRAGLVVEEAADGEAAIACCNESPPDVVVLDFRMPGLTGIEVARRLREEGYAGPIVIFSAYLDPQIEREAGDLGIRTLSKTDFEDLAAVIMSTAA